MNNIARTTCLLGTIALVAVLVTANTSAAPTGQWDFDSGNLNATVGSPLTYADADTTSGTQFGTTTALGITNINGSPANVMRFPIATNGGGYQMPTPPTANGGGSTVNQWTMIMDILYPSVSSGRTRPIIDCDASVILFGPEFIVNPLNQIGAPATGKYFGTVSPDTWYRLGISVNTASEIALYVNGDQVGVLTGADTGGTDGAAALTPASTALIFGSVSNAAAIGYVNSIQLRDVALNPGQMFALGGPAASGIPQVIPPVPSFISSRTPAPGATGVSEEPVITVVLNKGDATVTSSSIVLKLDGVAVGTMTATPPTYTVTYTVPPRLDPLSEHTLNLSWTDSMLGARSATWSFTVLNYQVVNLPTPFYFENFDSFTENPTPGVALPAGWTVQNQTAAGTAGFDLANRDSDSYKDWILISSARFATWNAERTDLPTIILNGNKVTSLTSGNLLWAESDSRCGSCNGQFSDLYTAPISCVGKTNVYVAFNSIYEQNQDNMDFMEYSIDGGTTWLPGIYYFDDDPTNPDIVQVDGVTDVAATFARIDVDRNWSPDTSPTHATNYGSYIKAPISAIKVSDIAGRLNDSTTDGKRIEVIRLPKADGQASVRFRFNANGTSAWFWGIDDFGLYEINAPVIASQPQSQTKDAGSSVTFTVVAQGTPAPTYQWQFNSTNISGAIGSSYTFIADTNNAGPYRVVVSNTFGKLNSAAATLTVVALPTFLVQPVQRSVNPGVGVSFTAAARGRPPIGFQWTSNNVPIAGATGTDYTIHNATLASEAVYACLLSNPDGMAASAASLKVVTNITRDLVVHLKFDGNYNDSSGRGNNASAVNTPSFGAGKIGNALEVNVASVLANNNNYATLGYPADLHFGTNTSFSIAFWTKVASWSGDPSFISNKDWDSGSACGWVIATDSDGHLQWNYRELDVAPNLNSRKDYDGPPGTFTNSTAWRHVAVVFNRGGSDGARAGTYVDGQLVDVRTLSSPNALLGGYYSSTTVDTDPPNPRTSTATAVNIGEDGSGSYEGAPIDAFIDDLGIWRRALTPGEVLAIYNAGLAGKPLSEAAPVTNPAPLNPSLSQSGGNILINKANTILESAPSLSGPWAEQTAARGTNVYYTAPTSSPQYYRGSQP
jgi:hypothetical protein